MIKGLSARFKCISHGLVKWNFSEGPLPNNIYTHHTVLFIRKASHYNSGTYECHGQTNNNYEWSNEPMYFYSKATLTVLGNVLRLKRSTVLYV